MKSFGSHGFLQLPKAQYLNLLLILAPLLNFLSGINIDLYAPSLPALADYFDVSAMIVKNTITITLLGAAIGCLFFGILYDLMGRRRVILTVLSIYILTSFLALLCHNISELMLVRFIQGLMLAATSIASRILVLDNFQGHQYQIGILYTSVTYSVGPIIAPFIGGYLQYYFGWQANFIAYGVLGFCLWLLFAAFLNEAYVREQKFSVLSTLKIYTNILRHKSFTVGVIVLGICNAEQLIYPMTGPFLIKNVLNQSAITYGNSALIMGIGYLIGTLLNRMLIRKYHLHHLTDVGFLILTLSTLCLFISSLIGYTHLINIVVPVFFINLSQGFIFGNILGRCLKIFPRHASMASSMQAFLLISVSTLSIFSFSHFLIHSFMHLSMLYLITTFVELFGFYVIFRYELKNTA